MTETVLHSAFQASLCAAILSRNPDLSREPSPSYDSGYYDMNTTYESWLPLYNYQGLSVFMTRSDGSEIRISRKTRPARSYFFGIFGIPARYRDVWKGPTIPDLRALLVGELCSATAADKQAELDEAEAKIRTAQEKKR